MNNSTGTPSTYWDEVAEAYLTRSYRNAGYSTWAAYMAAEWNVGELTVRDRRTVARHLASKGLSVKAVSVALGVGYGTVEEYISGPASGPQVTENSVYLIGSRDFRPVKIGHGNPAGRLIQCQVGNPFPLELLWTTPGGEYLERVLHARFADFRTRGEWFEFPTSCDPVAMVAAMAKQVTGVQ